ncbi:hypothetical protein [Candidatus Palauibacter sp.]|uniref:hypothetical protein n=1 Tax=Candidatus Palauibacter sp. TaxID=3101350 RepID=UPI003B014014
MVMPEAELDEIRDAARRNHLTVSAWVRRALRGARERELRGGGAAAVRETGPQYEVAESGLLRFVDLELSLPERDLEAVKKRYGLADWSAAVREAVGRQAVVPMTKEEALAMRGAGWEGDLDEIRADSPADIR